MEREGAAATRDFVDFGVDKLLAHFHLLPSQLEALT